MKNALLSRILAAPQELLVSVSDLKNFLPSNGCDLPPDTPIENITAFNNTIKNWTAKKKGDSNDWERTAA